MTELTCQQCREHAAELSLGVLTGRERAGALAHLDGCSTCQNMVSALTVTADRLVELLPGVEPPAGFEKQVITALVPPPPRARRWRVPVAAVVLAIAFAAGGWIVGRAYHDVPPPETAARTVMFTPLTDGDHQVGQAYVYPGHPSWFYVSLDTDNDTANGTIRCELVHRDGSTVPLGTFSLAKGYGAWGAPAAIDQETLASIRVINDSGHTLATAQFVAPATKADRPTAPPSGPTPPVTVPAPDGQTPRAQISPPRQPPGRDEPAAPSPPDTRFTYPHPGHRERRGR